MECQICGADYGQLPRPKGGACPNAKATRELTSLSPSGTTPNGLQERRGVSPALTPSELGRFDAERLSPFGIGEATNTPKRSPNTGGKNMRVPIVSVEEKPLMPCKPSKARKLMRGRQAEGRRDKLGVFYLQMLRPVGNKVQEIALAVDPGSRFDGYAVASARETQVKGMALLPKGIAGKMIRRNQLRRGRRSRKCRMRACKFNNRKRPEGWLAPSQKAKVDFRLKIVGELCRLYPIANIVVEDVKFDHYWKRWGKNFSTVEIGKTRVQKELKKIAPLTTVEGWETAEARCKYNIRKSYCRDALTPRSHANDAIAMLSNHYGRNVDSPAPFFVWSSHVPVRRQLHLQNPQKGGVRRVYGGTTGRYGIRKGDFVEANVKGKTVRGWACSFSDMQVGVADIRGKRFAIPTARNVRLIHRRTVPCAEFNPTLKGRVSLGGIR